MDTEIDNLKYSLNKITELGREMRRRQNLYFKTRNTVDLKYSKVAEEEFDNFCRLLEKRGYGVKTDNSNQPNLF